MKCEIIYENDDGKRYECDGELYRLDNDTVVCTKCDVRYYKK